MEKQSNSLVHSGIEVAGMLIIAVIIVSSLLLILNAYLATPSPQVAVTTTSMEPVYGGYLKLDLSTVPLDGDVLIIRNELPKLGDVIVYKSTNPSYSSTPIVHRVIGIKHAPSDNNSLLFLTQGDNYATNLETDVAAGISSANGSWVEQQNVIGVVIFRIPYIGWLSLQIQNANLRIFLLLALGIILLLMFKENEEEDKTLSKMNNKGKTNADPTPINNTKNRFFRIISVIKSYLTQDKSFKQWILHTGTGSIVATIILILIGVSAFGIGLYSAGPNTIQVYSQDNAKWSPGIAIKITTNTTPNIEIYPNINGSSETLYVIHTHIDIFSHGWFNWVDQIQLHINQTSSFPNYVWSITYAYNGNFIVNSDILLYINSTNTNTLYHETLIYTILSAGFLAQPVKYNEYNLIFQL